MDLRAATAALRAAAGRLRRHRRVAAAALAGLAVLASLHVLRPAPPASSAVWVAARALPGGQPLAPDDLRVEHLPTADVPTAALAASEAVVGRLLASPLTAGEPITAVRLLSPALLAATAAGALAVPVRLADGPAALALVHAGDLVDVIGTPLGVSTEAQTGAVVVRNVLVLTTPSTGSGQEADQPSTDAAVIIVAASRRQAAVLASASTDATFSVAVHPRR
ncbi:MAG TPA: Flp pilus assembly protein CpaB [Mycobacteriales bacterium]|nr:Flp pilus assembly protein CpaB [Mycobacteriales bacterium]